MGGPEDEKDDSFWFFGDLRDAKDDTRERAEACWLEPSEGRVGIAHSPSSQMAAQDTLQKLWLHGKAGGLAAREQLKAWALREAWLDGKTGTYGMHTWIAERLTKVGGGHPTNVAVKDLLHKIDNDEDWYPGKQYGEKRGFA